MQRGNLKNIGKIIKLSGNNGELIFSGPSVSLEKDFSETPVFIELQNQFVPFYIEESNSIGKDRFVIKFNFVNTVFKASLLLGKSVFMEGKDANSDSVGKEADLAGYLVIDENHGSIGRIISIDMNKKNPLIVIGNKLGEILIPFNADFILGIDTKKRILNIIAPTGLIELYTKKNGAE